jgi:hypothetical protein
MLPPYIFYRMNAATLIFKEPVGPTDPEGVKGFDRDQASDDNTDNELRRGLDRRWRGSIVPTRRV